MKYSISWLTKKAQKKTASHGLGLFAKEKIRKGERVIVFGGYVMTEKKFDMLPAQLKSFPFQLADDLYFGLSKTSEIEAADYLNHSCDPTCGFGGEITIVAMRDIQKGEELTIDYAMCSSNPRSITTDMKNCLCGLKNCRKTIAADDWKIKKLQKKYKGFFQPYLQKKLNLK